MDRYPQTSFGLPSLTRGVKALLLINAGLYVLHLAIPGQLAAWLGLSWSGLGEYLGLGIVRLVTYQFVHGEDPSHLLVNMLMLYFFGTMVEERIGQRGLVWLYLLAGTLGGIVQVLLSLFLGTPQQLTVGASGSCMGILVYAACMAPHSLVIFIVVPMRLWVLAAIVAGMDLIRLYLVMRGARGASVAYGAHVGGALFGFLAERSGHYGNVLWRLRGAVASWSRERGRRRAARKQEILDALLEKVGKQGLGSLTPAERRFLERTSRELSRR